MTDGVFVTFDADASKLEAEAKKSTAGVEGIGDAMAQLEATAGHLTQSMTKLMEAANASAISISKTGQMANAASEGEARLAQSMVALTEAANTSAASITKMGQIAAMAATGHTQLANAADHGGESMRRASKHVEEFNLNTSGARRELIVLAHEMAMGNYSRFGGSMMVMAERAGGVTLGMMGAAGAIAVMGVIAAQTAIRSEELSQALNRAEAALEGSGRAAMFSRDQLNGTIESLSRMNGIGKAAAEGVVGAFARIKDVTPQVMADLTKGMEGWVFLTGEEAPAAAEKLAKGLESPSKFMAQLDESIGGVSSATMAMVQQLERSGDVFAAKELAAKSFGEAGTRVADHMTEMQKALRDVGNTLSDLGDEFSHSSGGGDTLARALRVLNEMLDLLKLPLAVVAGAIRDLVDILAYLWHTVMAVNSALRPLGAVVVDIAAATAAAASGDFTRAANILEKIPTDIAASWKVGADQVKQHLAEMGAATADILGMTPHTTPGGDKSGSAGGKTGAGPTDDSAIKRGLTIAEQYRSTEMQREDIQGRINQLKSAEAALVSDIATRKAQAKAGDAAETAELKTQEQSLGRIRDAITEAERQKQEAGKGHGEESKLQGLEAQLDRRRDMEHHAAEEWKVIERDFWDAALKDATKGTADYDQILRRRTVAQKAVDEEAHQSTLASLERQREAAEKGSQARIDIARDEAVKIAAFEGEKSKAAQEALIKVEAMEREKADQARQVNAEIEAENVRHAAAMAATDRDRLAFMAQMGQISAADEISLLRHIRDQEYSDEMSALARQKQLMAQRPVELQKVLNQMKAAEDKYHRDVAKMDQQQVLERKTAIQSWVQPMTGAMHTMVQGVLQGTMTISQLFATALQGIAINYAEKGLEIAGNWLINQAAMALASDETAAQQTATATAATGAAIAQADIGALGSIDADAARAGAATYASISAIPVIGPELAPAAAEAAWADTMSFSGMVAVSERGLGSVPYDNFPALLHKEETVLPADLAVPLRSMVKSGPQFSLPANLAKGPVFTPPKQSDASGGALPGSGGGDTHYHINAVDAASFANMVQRGGPAVFKTFQGQIANGAKVSRPTK